MPRAQRVGGVFWLIGGIAAAVLLPFSPPTEQIGWVGWPIAALGIASCFAIAARRVRADTVVGLDELYYSGWIGLAAIALVQWLAGGLDSPYGTLYVLPALYAGAVHGTYRALTFLAVVAVAAALPLLYSDDSKTTTLYVVAQIVVLLALALTARGLIATVRARRAALMAKADDAERRARRDALTGLGNRLAFQEALVREVANARRKQRPLSVLLGDIENFKAINDTFGHLRGDECLRDVADAIQAQARAGDETFRWGGDEFAILLPETTLEQAAPARARLEREVSANCMTPDEKPLRIECAVTALRADQDAEGLLMEADRALTALKSGGGSRRWPRARVPT